MFLRLIAATVVAVIDPTATYILRAFIQDTDTLWRVYDSAAVDPIITFLNTNFLSGVLLSFAFLADGFTGVSALAFVRGLRDRDLSHIIFAAIGDLNGAFGRPVLYSSITLVRLVGNMVLVTTINPDGSLAIWTEATAAQVNSLFMLSFLIQSADGYHCASLISFIQAIAGEYCAFPATANHKV